MKLTLNRRDFIKSQAVAAAASVAGISVPGLAQAAAAKKDDGVRWDKGACRYCGTG
ncbi:MAG TPA: twin-arginine translocation signal domain-containing protein, partial [Accumulibacter sp.]|uniref:twin-arginine translocation signal domain-containing protein n=1 Tax=Accumulibacter sp. TaxID=2053492 RepID=UPI002BA3A97E